MKHTEITLEDKQDFLKKDLTDSLRWLFVGAVTWEAARTRPERCANQDSLAMYTNLVQAHALYDFFYTTATHHDDAKARDFAPSWKENGKNNALYKKYMAGEMPANKRIFHLVYKRSEHAGGPGHDGEDHIKNQVVKFADDLRKLTEMFVGRVETTFQSNSEFALDNALKEARIAADKYGIAVPF
jgi:hypothetical protein